VKRIRTAAELVAREPKLPQHLEVVARGRRAGYAVQALGEEALVGLSQRGPRRDDGRAEVEG
jgi:hypothetical protein